MKNNVDIKRVQAVLLKMGVEITNILDKHGIQYMIAFGTLLGAVRHKGFIPWDDDFDLFLFDDSYEQGIEFLRKELPNDMFVEDAASEPLYFHAWAHVKDMNSIVESDMFPQDNFYEHKGLSVDLYRIKRMPLYDLNRYINDENSKYIIRRREKGLIDDNEYDRRIKELQKKMEHEIFIANDRDIFGFITAYERKYLEIDDVLPLKQIVFENHMFYGPCQPRKVLQAVYGNYNQLPPEDKRKSHCGTVVFTGNRK